ncbi:MAG TPA: hypothetical protein VK508_10190 [Cyclobacteriaceae bacterium]|nr:hypothetical protein [Cyclobacteriaceae bacterium]
MTIRVFLLAAFWTLMFASCKEVTYREPQPAGVQPLKEIPQALLGKYGPAPTPDEKADTLIIESWGYHFKDSEDKDWLGRGVISDSLVIKFYKDVYFVNFRSEDQWALRLVKQKPNGDIEFLSLDIQDDEKSKDKLKKLRKKFKLTEVQRNGDTFYQINPTPAQLMALIKDGFFTGQTLTRKQK